ncbi:MAG: aldehyde dehydrogenase family protein [Acidobacteriota bacterium]
MSSEIDRIFSLQQANRWSVATTSTDIRHEKLRRLHDAILSRRSRIHEALYEDMRKPAPEVDLTEIFAVVGEARHAMRHLRRWMRPRRVSTPLAFFGSASAIHYEPKGLVLIISPWNFPINLTFGPMVSAIAAGNCVILKPSEVTPNTSRCIREIVTALFDENEVAVIEGDASVSSALLERPFDHIFFTGCPAVGRIVMKAAAEHLTSVTLELGGKSPVIVDRSANLREAARKIAWGKFLNNGQTCVAPDYVLVDQTIDEQFGEDLREATDALFGTEQLAGESAAYGRIVNDRLFERLSALLDGAVAEGASVTSGGDQRPGDRFLSPTILRNVSPQSSLMREEIFGPILPLIPYDDIDEALRVIDAGDRPLALYVFSRDQTLIDRVMAQTSAGGTMINDVGLHFFQRNLPFGGTGVSGFGKSHGRFGFEAFSNARGVMRQRTRFSGIQLMYPPYGRLARKLIDFTIRYL